MSLAILDHMSALADPIRARLLGLLERHELSVNELCTVLQLPQSTVSRHLKVLTDDGWVTARRDGTSHLYAMADGAVAQPAKRLWAIVREQVAQAPVAEQDDRRLQRVLAERRTKSQEFFASSAGRWDKLRSELFGDRFQLQALAAFLDDNAVFGDLGCGTGQLSETVAPFVRGVVAVDNSAAMLQAARKRVRGTDNVEFRRGELEALPLDDGSLDAAAMVLVLHHLAEPVNALREAARALKPGAALVIVDMLPHDRQEYRQEMGHVWLGFAPDAFERMLADAGFERVRIIPLPADPDVKGPNLFIASAKRRKHLPKKGTV